MEVTFELVLAISASILFVFLAIMCFKVVVKKLEEDDEGVLNFLGYDYDILSIFAILLERLLWLVEKIFPKIFYVFIFKLIVFLIGVGLIGITYAIWAYEFYK